MNYSDFSTEDFIADEKFIRWVNQPNEDLNLFWTNWLKANPSKSDNVNEAKSFIQSLPIGTNPLPENEVNDLLQNIHEKMDTKKMIHKKSKIRSLRWWSVAVAVVLLFAGGLWWMNNSNNTFTTAFNETQSFHLPDGSEVILNANSIVKTKKNWKSEADREVWLEGEAFFHVTKTPSVGARKFIVHANDVDIEVLGTEFNVNARNQKTTVVLKSGKIQLAALENNKKTDSPILVIPGERVVIQSRGFVKSNVNTEVYTSWTMDKIILDNTPFTHIVEILENNYGFKVEIKDKTILDKKLTGTAPLNKNPKVLLSSLSTMFNLDIKKQDSGIIKIDKK